MMQALLRRAGAAAQRRGVIGVPCMQDVVLPATEKHAATLIFMHGLGDTASGWHEPMKVVNQVCPNVRVVLPTAPDIPVTLNAGSMMPAWYDIKGLSARSNESCAGIDTSMVRIGELVHKEQHAEGHSGKVLLCGFSQGGALALYTGLQLEGSAEQGVVGIASLSSYLPCPASFHGMARMRKDIPLLMCHGDSDEVVRPEWAEDSRAKLTELGYHVDYKVYPGMGHQLDMNEFRDFVTWIKATLAL